MEMYSARFSRKVGCDRYHPALSSRHLVGDPSWYLNLLLPDPFITLLGPTRYRSPIPTTVESLVQFWTQLGWSFTFPSDVRFYHARMTQKLSRGWLSQLTAPLLTHNWLLKICAPGAFTLSP